MLPSLCQNQAGTWHVQAVYETKVASGIVEDGVVASLEDVPEQFCLASVRMMRRHHMHATRVVARKTVFCCTTARSARSSRHGAPSDELVSQLKLSMPTINLYNPHKVRTKDTGH